MTRQFFLFRRALLSFVVGFGFLVLIACSGGKDSPSAFEVELTFAPLSGGFQIGNQSDFGDFVSLKITATSEGRSIVERSISTAEFVDGSYEFTGLDDQSSWTFRILGTLGDGRQQEVAIVFVWAENEEDHKSGGIRAGINTDGDGRADSIDTDDDNDGIDDLSDKCPTDETGWVSNSSTDRDGDGCRDEDREEDREENREEDREENREEDREENREEDREENREENREEDREEDREENREEDREENREEDRDEDKDGYINGVDLDDDGDGLIEIGTAAELDAVRHALDGSGQKLSADGMFNSTGCDGDTSSCSGYELIANISLASYRDGESWQPLGHDTDNSTTGCQGAAFNGTFEGNGFRISDLIINRPNEDCVGLFGQMAVDSAIRNLNLHAETVMGRDRVGGLMGAMVNATITSSSISIGNISGEVRVGGLVGSGVGAKIISSSVVAGGVRGAGQLGGLLGHGQNATVISSSVVAAKVRGGDSVAALVGWGIGAKIISSSVVAGEVSGGGSVVGGLVGWGNSARIISSSVVVAEMSGFDNVGSLAGYFDGQLAYSYTVSGGTNADMLVGGGNGNGVASYWDRNTSGMAKGNHGHAKTSDELRRPTDYSGIYATWNNGTAIFGDEDEPLAIWCDEDLSGSIEPDERTDGNRVWDFGTDGEYPAIRCGPISPAEWRSWWFLNRMTNSIQLNQTRLNNRLPSLN